MTYQECLEGARYEWLCIKMRDDVLYMQYDISATETPEEEKNDLVYNYIIYKNKDGGEIKEYDGGLIETSSVEHKTPQDLDLALVETAFFPKVAPDLEVTRISEPDWAA